jgi:hypothetical protein
MLQNKNAQRTGQVIGVVGINAGDQGIDRHALFFRDMLQGIPEGFFQRNAGAVAGDGNGVLL